MAHLPKIVYDDPDELPEIFVTGVFGGVSPLGATIIPYVEDPVFESAGFTPELRISEVKRTPKVRIRMTPVAFKSMAQWMTKRLEQYEERFGKIELKAQPGNTGHQGSVDFQ